MTTLTAEQIRGMDATALWPYLVQHMPAPWLFQAKAHAYDLPELPVQWHMSMDGDYSLEADLTVFDCGNEARAAGFVRGLTRHIAREGGVVTVGLYATPQAPESAPQDTDEEGRRIWAEVEAELRRDYPEMYEPTWHASAVISGVEVTARPVFAYHADSLELALLRAFVAWKVGA